MSQVWHLELTMLMFVTACGKPGANDMCIILPQVWNLELMMCAQTLVRHAGSVTCVLASGGRIFSGAVDSLIKVQYTQRYI